MKLKGTIFALDLAAHTGFAVGNAGEIPRSGSVVLRKRGGGRGEVLGNLLEFLREEWTKSKPAIVAVEAPLPLEAFAKLGNAAATVRMTLGLHGIVEAMARRFGIIHTDIVDSTARKHFIGRGRMGTRDETKRAVIARAIALGYMPRGCTDDNRADACCIFDWASAHIAHIAPRELVMFGEAA